MNWSSYLKICTILSVSNYEVVIQAVFITLRRNIFNHEQWANERKKMPFQMHGVILYSKCTNYLLKILLCKIVLLFNFWTNHSSIWNIIYLLKIKWHGNKIARKLKKHNKIFQIFIITIQEIIDFRKPFVNTQIYGIWVFLTKKLNNI